MRAAAGDKAEQALHERRKTYGQRQPTKRELAEIRQEEEKRWQVQLEVEERVQGGTHRQTGTDIEGILGEVAPARLRRLKLQVPDGVWLGTTDGLTVTLDRRRGCELEVRSSDRQRAFAASGTLEAAIQPGVPWWGFMRAFGVGLGVVNLIWVLLLIGLPASRSLLFSLTLVVAMIAVGTSFLLERFLPGFELSPAGKASRGARAVGVLGVFVVSFLASVAANFVGK